MTKIILDLSSIKNELTQIHNEAFAGTQAKSDNERRDLLLKIIERVKSLKTKMDSDSVILEVK